MASPRHLVLKNLAVVLNKTDDVQPTEDRDVIPPPEPGGMQLYSFYAPSLVAANYKISISQRVSIASGDDKGDHDLAVADSTATVLEQTFEVVAPQFRIKAADIHSTYPPQGHADQPNVLPHIVLSDPHLPWERPIDHARSFADEEAQKIPWLAVLPFDCNGPNKELRLTDDQLNSAGAIMPAPTPAVPGAPPLKQTAAFTLAMTVEQYLNLPNSTTSTTKVHIPPYSTVPKQFAEIQHDQTAIDVIFLSSKLFKSLFGSATDATTTDLSPYRYVAHVRNVNTAGMTDAGVSDTGLFSIVHSLRSGPTNVVQDTAPRSQVVHLISLEHVTLMNDLDKWGDTDLIAMISLYSWTYLCQPPQLVNFVDSMRAIGDQIKDPAHSSMLRITNDVIQSITDVQFPLKSKISDDDTLKIKAAMTNRLQNGYTIVRHRAASGEETVAFNRGPLIPVTSTLPSSDWPFSSNTGQDYQILDKKLGILDISYSSAWQLGKTLATTDLGFVSALMRVRAGAHQGGKVESDTTATAINVGFKSKVAVMSNLSQSVESLDQLTNHAIAAPTANLRDRWTHSPAVDPKVQTFRTATEVHPIITRAFQKGVEVHMNMVSSGSTPGTTDTQPYNEFNVPNSTDWAFVQSWILDRLYLASIPSHYLVTDPRYLPKESIRFFHIDSNWMDCLVDGALSVANHMSDTDDLLRDSIKRKINAYLSSDMSSPPTQHHPQVPRYGFYLRSAVVTVFPDLVINVPYDEDPTKSESIRSGRSQVLFQKNVAKDILLVLLDRLPDSGELYKIKISQPPHQQRFSIGDSLTGDSVEFLFRKIYPTLVADSVTGKLSLPADHLHEVGNPVTYLRTDTSNTFPSVYDWSSQCLKMRGLETALFVRALQPAMSTTWNTTNSKLTSAITGLELNDTIKYLEIMGAPAAVTPVPAPQPYALRARVLPRPKSTSGAAAANNKSRMRVRTGIDDPPHTETTTMFLATQRLTTAIPPRASGKPAQSTANLPARFNTLTPMAKTVGPAAAAAPGPVSRAAAAAVSRVAAPVSRAAAPAPKASAPAPRAAAPAPAVVAPAPTPGPGLSNIARDSQFTYAVFPSTTSYTTLPFDKITLIRTSFVQTDTLYDPDLIFSINLRPADMLTKNLYISEVQLKIPIGDPNLRKQPDPRNPAWAVIPGLGLTPPGADWANVRAKMLNNQRWVVHLDPEPTYMNIRIIPRSMLMAYPVNINRNLSFKLDEVPLAGSDGKATQPGAVTVRVTEIFRRRVGDVAGGAWASMGTASYEMTIFRRITPAAGH